jgi:hypothetical protein
VLAVEGRIVSLVAFQCLIIPLVKGYTDRTFFIKEI